MGNSREMYLREFVGNLPKHHLARREYDGLVFRLRAEAEAPLPTMWGRAKWRARRSFAIELLKGLGEWEKE